MNARIPARRLGQSAFAALKPTPTYWTCNPPLPLRTRRTLATSPLRRKENHDSIPTQEKDISNPILEKYLEKQQQKTEAGNIPTRPTIREGVLPKKTHTILNPEYETTLQKPSDSSPEALQKWEAEKEAQARHMAAAEESQLSSLKLDPDPVGRRSWERKMVITSLRKRGRLTKAMKLKREERESRYKSPFLPTSIKKLTKLMNQIAGKTVEEALVQLRFSKKKVARDVWKGLKLARDEAIVGRGMGLGAAQEESTEEELKRLEEEDAKERKVKEAEKAKKKADIEAARKARSSNTPADVEDENAAKKEKDESLAQELAGSTPGEPTEAELAELLLPDGVRRTTKKGKATVIELKDGKSKRVYDPTEMYVDQAWVGRGTAQRSPEFRARGKVNMLTHRTTSFSVVLKEEKTRMRISEEIKKKRSTRKLWVALPDRPVTAQRQYCLW
ncbi:hypothetical protein K505DRAFT_311301 [Melanomma pulvis-pyrius CBS 109.77]|uniref:Ribosomal protein L22 n=1 Tax=Melanomma pulvis-pyrius CBS 109.77 TaxID=1314802 RepID=A0A6A6X2Q1_9PLEO|nr:hypothetical protein K505DRAFT_311301 [Melanomma pulvis-pyrius CBS 109.77]